MTIEEAKALQKKYGIEPDEAPVVLQALGYILFDEELYPEE